MKNSEDKILYLCDRKKDCKYSSSCGNECNHTLDPKHALNGVCDNPDQDERFKWEFKSWIEQEVENEN